MSRRPSPSIIVSMSNHKETWRLIQSPPTPGARNMALDDALLESVLRGKSAPILRLYQWNPACLSLGYAQPIDNIDRATLTGRGWDVVRRPTGGRAILHTDELTYAVILPAGHPLTAGGVLPSYQRLSAGLIRALHLLELQVTVQPSIQLDEHQRAEPVCFEIPSSYEITISGKKLLGSAQVRRKGALLQHGTLPLYGDISRICDVLAFPEAAERERAVQRVRERAGTVSDILGTLVSWDQAAGAMQQGFAQAFEITFTIAEPTQDEWTRCQALHKDRYQDEAWTARM